MYFVSFLNFKKWNLVIMLENKEDKLWNYNYQDLPYAKMHLSYGLNQLLESRFACSKIQTHMKYYCELI